MSLEIATTHHATASLPERLEYARSLAIAGLLPDAFRQQPANVLVGMELASALDLAPIVVINELAVIGGRPSFSAKFMRALVRRAGHKLRESLTANGTARCVIVRADDPEWEHVAEWDEAKARQHDYWGKGHWKKNPSLMLGNRALSECVRAACPEVLGGIAYTPDEVEDFAPATHKAEHIPAPPRQSLAEAVAAASPMPSSASPNSPDEPDGITDAQTRKLGALFRERGIAERDLQLAYISDAVGRDIASRSQLTKADATRVIDALDAQKAPEEGIDEATGEVVDAKLVDPWTEVSA